MAIWKYPLNVREIPVGGFRGLNESLPPTARPLGALSSVSNLIHDPAPSLKTRTGLAALGSAVAAAASRGIFQYKNLAGTTVQTLAQASTRLVQWNGEFWIGITAGDDTFTKLADPASLPAGNGTSSTFSPDGTYLAVAHFTTPFVTIYKRSGDTFTKLADPATLPTGSGTGVAFSSDGVYLSVAHYTTPFVTIYKRSGDTFTKLANPATLPTSDCNHTAFSPDGVYLALPHDTSPYVTIYKRSGDVFTKLANPATLPPSNGYGVAFSPDGVYLSVCHNASPYVTIYKRSGDVFTKIANPTTLPTGVGETPAFSPDGVYLSVTHLSSPYVTIYKRAGDVFTKLADPAALPASDGYGSSFSSDGLYLSVAHATSPFVTIYKRAGDVFTKLANPATLPVSTGIGTAFSPDVVYLAVAHYTSPYVTIYKRDNATAIPDKNFAGANLNDYACLFWAGSAPRKWSGTALTALGGSPPQGEFAVEAYQQIFVCGIPGRLGDIDWCDVAAPETWAAAPTNEAGSQTASTAPTKWIGFDRVQGKVCWWTTWEIGVLNGPETPNRSDLWSVRTVAPYGTPNGRTVQDVGGMWIWLTRGTDKTGFAMWAGGAVDVAYLPIKTSLGLIDWANITNACSWINDKGHYCCSVPKTGGTLLFEYDPATQAWYVGSTKDIRASGIVTISGVDYHLVGNEVSQMYEAIGTDDGGTAITWSLEIGPSTLGDSFHDKQILQAVVIMSASAGATVTAAFSTTETGSYGTSRTLSIGTNLTKQRFPVPIQAGDPVKSDVFRLKLNGTGVVTIHDVLLRVYAGGA